MRACSISCVVHQPRAKRSSTAVGISQRAECDVAFLRKLNLGLISCVLNDFMVYADYFTKTEQNANEVMLRRTLATLGKHRKFNTHRSAKKNAKRGHLRSMPYIAVGNNFEQTECIGHELEAFENFAVYADRYEVSPILRYTDDFNKLNTHEKMEALLNKMENIWKGRDTPALIMKLQYCVQLVKCFVELCEEDKAMLEDYTDDYQERFDETVEATCRIARKVSHDYPDASAALLYVAQACVSVGEVGLQEKCLDLSSFLIERIGSDLPADATDTLPDEASFAEKVLSGKRADKKELS